MGAEPQIQAFFDEPTNTVSYLVWDPASRRGVVIDPVLDFDPAERLGRRRFGRGAAGGGRDAKDHDRVGARNPYPCRSSVRRAADQGPHRRQIAIGEHVREVQKIFRPIFGAEDVKATAATSTGCSRTASGWRSAACRSK